MITIDMISQANSVLNQMILDRWLSQEFLTIKWWGLLGYLVFSYILCFTLLNKRKLVELLLYGSLVAVFSVVTDVVLSNRNYFLYKTTIFPMIPSIFVYDITALPLYYMLIYQYADSWKKYVVWITIASAVMGFVFNPLLLALDYVEFINWSNIKGFLVVLAVGLMAKAWMSAILYIQEKYQDSPEPTPRFSQIQPAMKPAQQNSSKQEGNQ